MQQELARHLSVNPTEIVHAVTMEILSAIVKRMGKKALSLTVEHRVGQGRDQICN